MRKTVSIWMTLALALGLGFFAGCDNSEEEELNKQILMQIETVEEQIAALEKHQEVLRVMIADLQTQLEIMEQELDRDAPRIRAANSSIGMLRQLTTEGFGESPAEYTIRTSSNWGWVTIAIVTLLLLTVWLFYRIGHQKPEGQ